MRPPISLRQRLRYAFDNTMARGPGALILWLLLVSVVLVAIVSGLVVASGVDPDHRGFWAVAWAGLMRTMASGTMGGAPGPWSFLFLMLLIPRGGIFVFSTLIGILPTGIGARLDEL